MNIDTLNAYCRPVLVTGLPLCQGRLTDIHLVGGHRAVGQHCPPRTSLSAGGSKCAQLAWLVSQLLGWLVLPGWWLAESLALTRHWASGRKLLPDRLEPLPNLYISRPDIKGGYPPNLSILISGGKENNCDSLSNGE